MISTTAFFSTTEDQRLLSKGLEPQYPLIFFPIEHDPGWITFNSLIEQLSGSDYVSYLCDWAIERKPSKKVRMLEEAFKSE